jgi:hypothetical protein
MDGLMPRLREISSITLDSLVTTIGAGIPHYPSFSDGYDEWSTLSTPDYETRFTHSLDCYSSDPSDDLCSEITRLCGTISDLSFSSLISFVSRALTSSHPTVSGILFAADLIIRATPSIFTPDLISVGHSAIDAEGPVLRWLIGRILTRKYCAVSANSIVSLFIDEMLNDDRSSSAISVAAMHLLTLCAGQCNPLSAENYSKLIELSQRQSTPRDKHVVRLLVPFMKVAHVSDIENFPRELLVRFPDAPRFVGTFFLRGAMHDKRFLSAWVKTHAEMHEASMNYLRVLALSFPVPVLAHFPKEDWIDQLRRSLYEKSEKKARRRRWCVTFGILALVIALIAGYAIVGKL